MEEYDKMIELYSQKCDDCLNKGILKDGKFCDCEVGMAESLMVVSAEADALLE